MRSASAGVSIRAATSGAQPQPSRASVRFAVQAPSRSAQFGSSRVASKRPATALSAAAAAASACGGSSPSTRLSPPGVGTAKRAGCTKANSSSRSRPESSG
jgi:hypothetical protein